MASPINQPPSSFYLPIEKRSVVPVYHSSTNASSFPLSPLGKPSGFTSPIKATGTRPTLGDETISTMAYTPANFSGIITPQHQNASYPSLHHPTPTSNRNLNSVIQQDQTQQQSTLFQHLGSPTSSGLSPAAASHHLQQYKLSQKQQHSSYQANNTTAANLSTTDTLNSFAAQHLTAMGGTASSLNSAVMTNGTLNNIPSTANLSGGSLFSALQPTMQTQNQSVLSSSTPVSNATTASTAIRTASTHPVMTKLTSSGSMSPQFATSSSASLSPVNEEKGTPQKKLSKKATTEGKAKKLKKAKKSETTGEPKQGKKSKSTKSRPPLASGNSRTFQSSNGETPASASGPEQTPTATALNVNEPALVRLAAAVQANPAGAIQRTNSLIQPTTTYQDYTTTAHQQRAFTTTAASLAGHSAGMTSMHTHHHQMMQGEGTTISMKSGGFTATGQRILSERVVEREIKIPKRIRLEETIEHYETRSETVLREEIIEESHMVKEHITEVKKPVIKEKLVQVPQIEYRDKVVEVQSSVSNHKIVERPNVQVHERVIEVPKLIQQERIVEVVEFEYRDVPIERIVEVPEVHEEITIVEKRVPQVITREEPQYNDIHIDRIVERRIPVPMEQVTEVDFDLPIIEPVYINVDVPIYVPRFIEIACPVEAMDNVSLAEIQAYADRMSTLSLQSAMTLGEVERLSDTLRQLDPVTFMKATNETEVIEKLVSSWRAGVTEIQDTHILKPNVIPGLATVMRQSSAPAAPHQSVSSLVVTPGRTTVDWISQTTRIPKRAISHSITTPTRYVEPNPLAAFMHETTFASAPAAAMAHHMTTAESAHFSNQAAILLRNSLPSQFTQCSVLNVPASSPAVLNVPASSPASETVSSDHRERTSTVESAAFTSLDSEPAAEENSIPARHEGEQ